MFQLIGTNEKNHFFLNLRFYSLHTLSRRINLYISMEHVLLYQTSSTCLCIESTSVAHMFLTSLSWNHTCMALFYNLFCLQFILAKEFLRMYHKFSSLFHTVEVLASTHNPINPFKDLCLSFLDLLCCFLLEFPQFLK